MLRAHRVAVALTAASLHAPFALAQTAAPPNAPLVQPAPMPPPALEAAPPGAPPIASAGAAFNGPEEMRFVDGRPIPPGYHMESRPRKGLVVSGPIIFGIPFVLSASVGASSQFDPDRWLYLPVIGPFADLGARGSQCTRSTLGVSPGTTNTTESCVDDSGARFGLMLDGLLQTAGATMFILGLALPTHLLVRDDAPYRGSIGGIPVAWTVRPVTMGRAGYGLGIDGIF
jgi:hypothetical protein